MAKDDISYKLRGGRIKIRHLQCLLEVIRQGSLTKAAIVLGRTQPAVSKTLNELELEVGVALLRRTRGGISLTPEGQDFYRFAGVAVSAVNAGLHSIAVQCSDPAAAPVKLGCLPNVACRLMPDVMRVFIDQFPTAHLSILTGSNNGLIPDLRNGDIELIVGRMPELDQMLGLTFQPLYEEVQVFVVRPGHRLLVNDVFDVNDLIHYQLIMHRAAQRCARTSIAFWRDWVYCARSLAIIMNSPDLARHYMRMSDAILVCSLWCRRKRHSRWTACETAYRHAAPFRRASA